VQESWKGAYGAISDPSMSTEADPTRATIAMAWVSARRERDLIFGGSLFLNPAWDILLDLYINHVQGRVECVSSICVASSAPPTTVSRWIVLLEKQGLIERTPDLNDKRRSLLGFSSEGLRKMEAALDASAKSDERLGLGRLRLIK
jgi:DNA-binding MarR family transcriptional regulator